MAKKGNMANDRAGFSGEDPEPNTTDELLFTSSGARMFGDAVMRFLLPHIKYSEKAESASKLDAFKETKKAVEQLLGWVKKGKFDEIDKFYR